MGNYKELAVWRKAHQVTLSIYEVTKNFPKEKIYGLTNQMRRAAVSIPSNIAEGAGKGSDSELIRYLRIALGSANELDYQLLLSHDLRLLDVQLYTQLSQNVQEVCRMLNGLIQTLTPRNR